MVLRNCLGMIMSVSTLIIWSGAATPSRTVNLSIYQSCSVSICMRRAFILNGGGAEGPSRNARLDGVHVVVRQAEMVADLVHQHMGDDRPQRLLVLAPIIEDRPAVEPDHVRHLHRRAVLAERQAD